MDETRVRIIISRRVSGEPRDAATVASTMLTTQDDIAIAHRGRPGHPSVSC